MIFESTMKAGDLFIYNYQIHKTIFFLPKIRYSIIFRKYQNVNLTYEYTSCVQRALTDHASIILVSL